MFNISEIAKLVADRMVSIVDANRKSFIETDDFESVFENCFDMLVAPKIPKWAYVGTYNEVESDPEVALAYMVCKEMIAEERVAFEDAYLLSTNPMAYYGLKQKDFI
jgi:hypothetical protein